MIENAVIAAAGLGTRLLSTTKEQPKEMLPIFAPSSNGELSLKPTIQLVFEQLHDAGFTKFCFVVGRGKRTLVDHFTPDANFVEGLRRTDKQGPADDLDAFYRKIDASSLVWLNQPQPLGFGHALLMYKPLAPNEPFLVHAGDTYVVSDENKHLERLVAEHQRTRANATLLLLPVSNTRAYGVAEVTANDKGELEVKHVVEKPEAPPSNLAIMPVYVFDSAIFKALEATTPGVGGEIQLTDAIQKLIEWQHRVRAIKLNDDEFCLDIGGPTNYLEALKRSYDYFRWGKLDR